MAYLELVTCCVLLFATTDVASVQFQFQNNEGGPVWVGIQGNPGHPHLSNGGFILQQGQGRSINAPDNWRGRFWPRTWCNGQSNFCETGDCGRRVECAGNGGNPPASLAEITLKGAGGLDYYDISLVDGFNIRISMEPINGQSDGGRYSCKKAACGALINNDCPGELQVKHGNIVIGCKSACLAFNTDQYCCRGAHNRPETCRSTDWPKNYPKFFKDRCPDAYSYAYDDHKSTFTCRASTYRIVFG